MDPLKWLYKKCSFYFSLDMDVGRWPRNDDADHADSDYYKSSGEVGKNIGTVQDISYAITDSQGGIVGRRESADSSSNNSGT